MSQIPSVNLTVMCKGRNSKGEEVLLEKVSVSIFVRVWEDEKTVAHIVTCPHLTGSHGHRCKASFLTVSKTDEEVACPYAIDIK